MKWNLNSKFKNLLFFAIIVVYSVLLISIAYKINISEDETYTLNTTSRDLGGVIKQSYYFEAQPPVYFILFSWWRHINSSIFFAKLFSVFFVGLSSCFFYRIVIKLSGKEYSKWMVLIFLLNPFTVWAALLIRTYAFLIFLSIFSLYFFFRYYFEEKKYFLYLFLLISLIGVYTQYFFIFLISSLAIIILIFKGWKSFYNFCLYLIPIMLLFLPNLLFLSQQIKNQETHINNGFTFNTITSILHTPQDFLLAINLIPNTWINRTVRLLFFIPAIYAYAKLFSKYSIKNNLYLKKYNKVIIAISILIPLFIIAFLVTRVNYIDNYLVVVFPLFIMLFSIYQNFSKVISRILYACLIMYYVALLFFFYRHPVIRYDFKSLASYINHIEGKDEPLIFYRPAVALPFAYYYHGKNPIYPIPHEVKFDTSYLLNIKDSVALKQSIDGIKTSSNSYLLISDTTIYEGKLDMNRKMVDNYLSDHYIISLDTLFYGWSKSSPLRIRRFEKNNLH